MLKVKRTRERGGCSFYKQLFSGTTEIPPSPCSEPGMRSVFVVSKVTTLLINPTSCAVRVSEPASQDREPDEADSRG